MWRYIITTIAIVLVTWADESSFEYRPLSLQERVDQATLIVVGTLGWDNTPSNGKHQNRNISVETVLLGRVPEGKALRVEFTCTELLIPNIAPMPQPSRWIIFVTDIGVSQSAKNVWQTKAVGKLSHSHDGLTGDSTEVRQKVVELIAERRKRESTAGK